MSAITRDDIHTTVDELYQVATWASKEGNYDAGSTLAGVAELIKQLFNNNEQLLGRVKVLEEECNWLEAKNRAANMVR